LLQKYNDFVEWLSRSVTFVQPKRLPVTAARFMDTCKELKVDESGRRQFTMDLPIYKSIEMEGKVGTRLNFMLDIHLNQMMIETSNSLC